jgi:hypothetical protein
MDFDITIYYYLFAILVFATVGLIAECTGSAAVDAKARKRRNHVKVGKSTIAKYGGVEAEISMIRGTLNG